MEKVYTIEEIKQNLIPAFSNAAVNKAILFGSYAKGLATENSDIDIVIDSNGQLLNIYFYELLEDVTERLNKKVDLIELSEIERGSLIYNEIQKEGIVVYEKQR
jgi:Predicted nucleotidyltransferases